MTTVGLFLAVVGFCAACTVAAPVEDEPVCSPVCTANYVPMCGSDGVTYSNQCMFDCARVKNRQLTKTSDTECGKVDEPTCPAVCTLNWSPVCGSDGKTYSNDCVFGCARVQNKQLTRVSYGECAEPTTTTPAPEACPCTREYSPVCGNDYKTYSNLCQLECAKKRNHRLKKEYSGECTTKEPQCVCTFIYSPVCGTNGVTYSNQCGLDCAAKQNKQITKKSEGVCPTTCACTFDLNPVCGTNGVTYDNVCSLNCDKQNVDGLDVFYSGPCNSNNGVKVVEYADNTDGDSGNDVIVVDNPEAPEVPADFCACTRDNKQVCGSNGKSYNNLCMLKCEARNTKTDIKVTSEGPCRKPCVCSRDINRVCGSNGVTYNNECLLKCNAGVTIAKKSAC